MTLRTQRWEDGQVAAGGTARAKPEQAILTLEKQGEEEESREMGEVGLPEELATAQSCRQKVKRALTMLDEGKTNHPNPHDHQARIMEGGDGDLHVPGLAAVVGQGMPS